MVSDVRATHRCNGQWSLDLPQLMRGTSVKMSNGHWTTKNRLLAKT